MENKFFSPKSALWALDFGERAVTALAVRQKVSGEWEILGEGTADALGRKDGEIAKLSDAVESVTEAIRTAERTAGSRCRMLFFNFDDADMVSAHPCGSKTLSGEGQIGREDVREASRSASRLVGDFERTPVYTRECNYLIDGKDSVGDPFGVYGHRLDVTLHVVMARAKVVEQWKSVMRRAGVDKFAAILSLDSVCHAVIENAALPRIVWDLGEDFVSGGLIERGVIREYRSFATHSVKDAPDRIASASRNWAKSYRIETPPVLAGDMAENPVLLNKLSLEGLQSVTGFPKRLGRFTEPSHASIVGLLAAGIQRARRGAYTAKTGGLWAGRVRDKANALIQEYF